MCGDMVGYQVVDGCLNVASAARRLLLAFNALGPAPRYGRLLRTVTGSPFVSYPDILGIDIQHLHSYAHSPCRKPHTNTSLQPISTHPLKSLSLHHFSPHTHNHGLTSHRIRPKKRLKPTTTTTIKHTRTDRATINLRPTTHQHHRRRSLPPPTRRPSDPSHPLRSRRPQLPRTRAPPTPRLRLPLHLLSPRRRLPLVL
jgi:hypothetical protein